MFDIATRMSRLMSILLPYLDLISATAEKPASQNDLTICLNWSIEQKYKRTNNQRTIVNEQTRISYFMIIVESSNVLIWLLHAPILNFSVIRIANIWMQQQFQDF